MPSQSRSEKQIVSSGIWTRVADSISYDDNRFTIEPPMFFLNDLHLKIWISLLKFNFDDLVRIITFQRNFTVNALIFVV